MPAAADDNEVLDLRGDKAVLLGRLAEALEYLRLDIANLKKANDEDHTKIFDRLNEGEDYMFILKLSRCALSRLDDYGIFKALILAAISALIGYQLA